MIVLDSGAVTRLAERSRSAAAMLQALRREGLWPPLVPSVVLIECLQGHPGRDAGTHRFLKGCEIVEAVPEALARRSAALRHRARRGSAVDALTVAVAEPGGTVLTSDIEGLEALACYAEDVQVVRV